MDNNCCDVRLSSINPPVKMFMFKTPGRDVEYCLSSFLYHLPLIFAGIFILIIVSISVGNILNYIQNENWKNLFSAELLDVISLPTTTTVLFVFSIIFILVFWSVFIALDRRLLLIIGLPMYCIVHTVIKSKNLDVNPLLALKQANSIGLGYANCMADSYFNGYLRIIIPYGGEGSPGMLEKLRDYQDRENVKIAIEKILILIPCSGYLPPTLEDTSNWIETRKPLTEKQLDRGGVQRRVYKNTVYSIQNPTMPRNPKFVVMEGATPIQTLLEATKANTDYAIRLRQSKKRVIKQFYETLKLLLESDQEFHNRYELIYYDDEGGSRNVGKMILDKFFSEETEPKALNG